MVEESTPSSANITRTVRPAVEWPTLALAALIYGGWVGSTYWFNAVPWWVALPVCAWFTAWQLSLQHEIIHGHPTRRRWVNTALGFAPLSLWLPFARYRQLHLTHHRDPDLTDPIEDPESFYVSAEIWQRRSKPARALSRFLNTSVGRILFNPARTIPHFLSGEVRRLARGSAPAWRIWAAHAIGVAAVLVWTGAVCGIPLWQYCLFFVYPGYALASVRSFVEHRAAALPAHRTAIVERAPVFGLLFLHNNLHVVHHDHPAMPWYSIPTYYRAHRDALIRGNDGLVYNGYGDAFRRYLFQAHHGPVAAEQPLAG